MKSTSRESEDLLSRSSGSVTVTPEDLNLQIEQAQRLLMEHERQLDDLSRQKHLLEDIKRKQLQVEEGLRVITENLHRGLVILEGQEHQIRKEIEQVEFVRNGFSEQLELVRGINPNQWNSKNPLEALTQALATLDQARLVYEQSRSKIDALRSLNDTQDENAQNTNPHSFFNQVISGFAYSLPLLIAIILILIVLVVK